MRDYTRDLMSRTEKVIALRFHLSNAEGLARRFTEAVQANIASSFHRRARSAPADVVY